MHKINAYILGFRKISISFSNPKSFSIEKLLIKSGCKTLTINSYTTKDEDSFLVFLNDDISIKSYCYVYYDGMQIKASYTKLFITSEFNNRFFYDGNLGLTYTREFSTFRMWSPAATHVSLLLYKNGDPDIPETPIEKSMNEVNGLWSIILNCDLKDYFYTYKIHVYDFINETVDPYAVAVGINGFRGAVIDLKETNPANWHEDSSPLLKHHTDAIIYETSVRDISMHPNSGVIHKGKFLGLTEDNTFSDKDISTGLSHIKELGVTHIQFMPFYDFSNISTDEKNPQNYSWGYDPQNYNVPEGIYSTNPYKPKCRILELKKMIQHLHSNELRINMDVVYNHLYHKTDNSFEKIFPGYYFRFNEDGSFSNGSGCGNDTASEHSMMRKFIIDSIIYWIREYHIDGFRFDLMGLHDIETMKTVYTIVSNLNKSIMLYGEGWNLNTSLLENIKATQLNAAKIPGIGFFNDTIRDTIKGNVFVQKDRGFVNGKEGLEDIIKACIAGCTITISNFKSIYTSPNQSINYVSCHDNNTLWDKLEFSNKDDTLGDRKNMVKLANGIILTSQGVPFLHSGVEFCRTKEGIDDSVNACDRINTLDYDRKAEFLDVFNYYKGLIKLRREHPAFRMISAEDIKSNLEFINDTPKNIVAFLLKNHANEDAWEKILVAYNANKTTATIDVPKATWHQIIDKSTAGTNILRTFSSDKVEIEGISMSVFYSN
ncbi:type I pullulanase [Clostridium bovifaecis]|uniref:Type I pullulanase n=1 Tax=Clostridium bovifaecis TaxID=2184719 RepID=A0A6I6EQ70_9CLOT|nr:type I pullulanase [Clostridium bovifaecis]